VIIIDEAQHLLRMAGGHAALNQMESIKDLMHVAKVPIVLSGTRELVTALEINDQVYRRTKFVHFPPYLLDAEADRGAFADVLQEMQRHLPCKANLLDIASTLYAGSLGLVGVLWEWVLQAVMHALEEDRSWLAEADFLDTAQPAAKLEKMLSGIRLDAAEARRIESRDLNGIRNQLHLTSQDRVDETPSREVPRSSAQARPGTRKPQRDPVGRLGGAQETPPAAEPPVSAEQAESADLAATHTVSGGRPNDFALG
jgi:hypothetical protein